MASSQFSAFQTSFFTSLFSLSLSSFRNTRAKNLSGLFWTLSLSLSVFHFSISMCIQVSESDLRWSNRWAVCTPQVAQQTLPGKQKVIYISSLQTHPQPGFHFNFYVRQFIVLTHRPPRLLRWIYHHLGRQRHPTMFPTNHRGSELLIWLRGRGGIWVSDFVRNVFCG